MHAPELTTVAAATSGRPSGLHAMACHTASMVAPSDPGLRATAPQRRSRSSPEVKLLMRPGQAVTPRPWAHVNR